jgi:hypothetical protein
MSDIAVKYFLNEVDWYYFVGNTRFASSTAREVDVLSENSNLV